MVVAGNRKCVANIADAGVFAYLLMVVHTLPPSRLLALETTHALMANTTIVKEAMQKGCLIYLLDLFCNSQNPNVREQSAALFAKMMSDKLIGPKVGFAADWAQCICFLSGSLVRVHNDSSASQHFHQRKVSCIE